MLFFLGVAAIAFTVASLMHGDSTAEPETMVVPGGLDLPAPTQRKDPLAPFKTALLIVAGGASIFYAGRHGLRAATRTVAARAEGGRLHLHSSYGGPADPVPVEAITDAIFDRADHLPGAGSGSAKLGARLRHGLYLRYRVSDTICEARLIDNDVDGGAEQLRRFAANLDMWRAARRDRSASAG